MRIFQIPLFMIIGIIGLVLYILIDIKKNRMENIINRGIFYSFIGYLIVVSHLTIGNISIPPQTSLVKFQLVPFNFVGEWLMEFNRGTWFLLNSIKYYFFNLIMFAPFGIYLGLLFNIKRVQKVLIILFLSSLTIEIIQPLLSYYGLIFGRTFDVDDLILNTLGGTLAYLVWVKLYRENTLIGTISQKNH